MPFPGYAAYAMFGCGSMEIGIHNPPWRSHMRTSNCGGYISCEPCDCIKVTLVGLIVVGREVVHMTALFFCCCGLALCASLGVCRLLANGDSKGPPQKKRWVLRVSDNLACARVG